MLHPTTHQREEQTEMTTTTNKENTTITQAINCTTDQIGLKIRQRQDLLYDKSRNMLTRRVMLDTLEQIINREFTKLYHFLKFKKYHIYAYDINKICRYQDQVVPDDNLYGKAEIRVTFVWGKTEDNMLCLNWTYDWLMNTDITKIKHVDQTNYTEIMRC